MNVNPFSNASSHSAIDSRKNLLLHGLLNDQLPISEKMSQKDDKQLVVLSDA